MSKAGPRNINGGGLKIRSNRKGMTKKIESQRDDQKGKEKELPLTKKKKRTNQKNPS